MSRVRKNDQIEIDRYLDGELGDDAARRFEARLQQEPALREALGEAEAQRRFFVEDRDEVARQATVGLADAVMQQVATFPRRKDLMRLVDSEEFEVSVAGFGRRVAAAAALLIGLAIVVGLSFMRPASDDSLQAVDDKIRQIDERALEAMARESSARRPAGDGK